MRHIAKGGAPGVLTGTGAEFQDAALSFAHGHDVDGGLGEDLRKFAVYVGDQADVFAHYGSGLFAKYSFYSDPTVKRRLIAETAGKCAFCEAFVMATDVGDVEHFRPKAQVTVRHPDTPDIQVPLDAHPGYFWLSATWENLYLSCKQCNQAYKRNFFDVWPDTPRATPAAVDQAEDPLLLSPGLPDAALRRLIRYDPATAQAMLNPENPFGALPERDTMFPRIQRTIEIVGLNRPRLIQARANHLVKLRALFVLVANSGGMAPDHAAPQATDETPAILDFGVPDGAASDALSALESAVAPAAEFSALAIDALLVWSAALEFQAQPAQVALQQDNQIRLQIGAQRLQEAVALAERAQAANAASSEAESEADTTDLDALYNKALRAYKVAICAIGGEAAALAQRRAQADQASATHDQIRTQNGLADFEEQYDLEVAYQRQGFIPIDVDDHPGIEHVPGRIAEMEAQMAQPPLAQLIQEDNARRAEIDDLEQPLDDHWSTLNEINGDVIDVEEAYRIRGTSRAARGARCEALLAALGDAMTWLDSGAGPGQDVQNHMQGRGYPPAIRG